MQYYWMPTHLITYVQNECYYKWRSSHAPAIATVVRLIIQLIVNWDVYRIFEYSFIENIFNSFTFRIFVLALLLISWYIMIALHHNILGETNLLNNTDYYSLQPGTKLHCYYVQCTYSYVVLFNIIVSWLLSIPLHWNQVAS